MENVMANKSFISHVLIIIRQRDSLHFKQLKTNMRQILCDDWNLLHNVICKYFVFNKISPQKVADDYLHMITDMRHEMGYFIAYNRYSCRSQEEALEKFYSKPEVMDYYLNALLVSYLLWQHHFKMLMFFKRGLSVLIKQEEGLVLDIGSGHGLNSYLVHQVFSDVFIDVVDINNTSLDMTKVMLSAPNVSFYNKDIFDYKPDSKYDLIILGELLEHLDDPEKLLYHVKEMLSPAGVLWLTVPTNAPAIDHVYLFRNEQEITSMIDRCGFNILESLTLNADSSTQLIGAFCIAK
jgi:2-polyprenyl-3-methyl-5-hydroxy-6-metoxy-1,4-benzoquinol methylase